MSGAITPIATALLSSVAAFVGSWLAARFALLRYYQERIWERRAEAYTSIFGSLHDMEQWLSEALANDVGRVDISTYESSHTSLARRISSESWLLSENFRKSFEAYIETDVDTSMEINKFLQMAMERHREQVESLREIVREEMLVRPSGRGGRWAP